MTRQFYLYIFRETDKAFHSTNSFNIPLKYDVIIFPPEYDFYK